MFIYLSFIYYLKFKFIFRAKKKYTLEKVLEKLEKLEKEEIVTDIASFLNFNFSFHHQIY